MSLMRYAGVLPGSSSVFSRPKLNRIGVMAKTPITMPWPRNLLLTTVCTNIASMANPTSCGNTTRYSSLKYIANS